MPSLRGAGRRNSRNSLRPYWWIRSSFNGSGRPMMRIASNGHFLIHIEQEMHVSSLIAAFPVSSSIQMTSVPRRCGGQKAMHSWLQRFGWHRSLKTTATRMDAFRCGALYKGVRKAPEYLRVVSGGAHVALPGEAGGPGYEDRPTPARRSEDDRVCEARVRIRPPQFGPQRTCEARGPAGDRGDIAHGLDLT